MRKHRSTGGGKDFIVFPALFVLLTFATLYLALAPIVKPYLGLAQMMFSQDAAKPADRFDGVVLQSDGNKVTLTAEDCPAAGDKIGRIYIDGTSVDAPLYYGDSNTELNKGVGIYASGWYPGQGRTILVAGHVGTFFMGLEQVELGMTVTVETYYGTYEYRVTDMQVKEATDTSAYDFTVQEENLILYTCYPFGQLGSTPYRYFVYAEYVSGPGVVYG